MLEQLFTSSWFHKICSLHPFVFFRQLMEAFQTGLPGLNVASHVAMEVNSVTGHAPIHLPQTVENNAREQLRKQAYVPIKCALHEVNI